MGHCDSSSGTLFTSMGGGAVGHVTLRGSYRLLGHTRPSCARGDSPTSGVQSADCPQSPPLPGARAPAPACVPASTSHWLVHCYHSRPGSGSS